MSRISTRVENIFGPSAAPAKKPEAPAFDCPDVVEDVHAPVEGSTVNEIPAAEDAENAPVEVPAEEPAAEEPVHEDPVVAEPTNDNAPAEEAQQEPVAGDAETLQASAPKARKAKPAKK